MVFSGSIRRNAEKLVYLEALPHSTSEQAGRRGAGPRRSCQAVRAIAMEFGTRHRNRIARRQGTGALQGFSLQLAPGRSNDVPLPAFISRTSSSTRNDFKVAVTSHLRPVEA